MNASQSDVTAVAVALWRADAELLEKPAASALRTAETFAELPARSKMSLEYRARAAIEAMSESLLAAPLEPVEPRHPDREADEAVRVSLLEAIKEEAKLQRYVSEADNLNSVDKRAAVMISLALKNIAHRWARGGSVEFDREALRFNRIKGGIGE